LRYAYATETSQLGVTMNPMIIVNSLYFGQVVECRR
jgi:hypothetical protein